MSNDYLAPIAAKLTLNAAINLRHSVETPCSDNPDSWHGSGRIYTGLGKWTTLSVIGIENNIISLGLAKRLPPWDWAYLTPLGHEVAQYVHDHWDELEFRVSKR